MTQPEFVKLVAERLETIKSSSSEIVRLISQNNADINAGSMPRYIGHIRQHLDRMEAADIECNLLRNLPRHVGITLPR